VAEEEAMQMRPCHGKEMRAGSQSTEATETVGNTTAPELAAPIGRDSGLPNMARTYAHIYHAPRPWMSAGLSGSCKADSFFHINFGVSRSTPFMARRMARYILSEWKLTPETVGTAELLASELATNAVRSHSAPSVGGSYVPYISLTLWRLPGLVVIEVSDENEKPPVIRVANQESDGGRGLVIVQALSREWAYYYPRPGWKTVYCVLDASPGHRVNRGG
jgi:hypothetical protein